MLDGLRLGDTELLKPNPRLQPPPELQSSKGDAHEQQRQNKAKWLLTGTSVLSQSGQEEWNVKSPPQMGTLFFLLFPFPSPFVCVRLAWEEEQTGGRVGVGAGK